MTNLNYESTMPDKGLKIIPIHTSDIIGFKKCRRRWDMLSDLRMGRKPIEAPRPLDFGQAFHAGMAVFYDPKTWAMTLDERRPIMVAAAVTAFKNTLKGQKQRYLRLMNAEALEDDAQTEYLEDLKLGEDMLAHYFDYVASHGLDDFEPLAVELGFEVALYGPDQVAKRFRRVHQEALAEGYSGAMIVYRGRVDALVKDTHGRVWVVDWKTTVRLEPMANLELDEQLGSYNWALELQLGIKIAGNIYAEIYKGAPAPPARLKNARLGRIFSTSKTQTTSYDLMMASLEEAHEPVELYEDYLTFLKHEGLQYVRRTETARNRHELAEMDRRILNEAADMLRDDLYIYPSPDLYATGAFSCRSCPVKAVCIGMNDGSDWEDILNTYTTKETRTNG